MRIRYSPGVIRLERIDEDGNVVIDDVVVNPYAPPTPSEAFKISTGINLEVTDTYIRSGAVVGNQYIREFGKLEDSDLNSGNSSSTGYGVRGELVQATALNTDGVYEWAGLKFYTEVGIVYQPVVSGETSDGEQIGGVYYTYYPAWGTGSRSPYGDIDCNNVKVSDGEPRPPPPDYSIEQPPAVAPPIPIIIRDLPDFTDVPLYSNITISVDVSPCSIQWYEVGVGPLSLQFGQVLQSQFEVELSDEGRQFYAICTGPGGDAVVTNTTTIRIASPSYDPFFSYVVYINNFNNFNRGLAYGVTDPDGTKRNFKWAIDGRVGGVTRFATRGSVYKGSASIALDRIQDWTSSQLADYNTQRFGPASLRINGIADYNRNGIDYWGQGFSFEVMGEWYRYENSFTEPVSVFQDPAVAARSADPETSRHSAPAVSGDFTVEAWVKADSTGQFRYRTDSPDGDWLTTYEFQFAKRREIADLQFTSTESIKSQTTYSFTERGAIFVMGDPTAERVVKPKVLHDKGYIEGPVIPSNDGPDWIKGNVNMGMLYALKDGRLGWSSFVSARATGVNFVAPDDSEDIHAERTYTVTDGDKGNVRDGQWHFVSVSRTRGTIYLHIDGVLAGSGYDPTVYGPKFPEEDGTGAKADEKKGYLPMYVGSIQGQFDLAGVHLNPALEPYRSGRRTVQTARATRIYGYTEYGGDFPWMGNIDSVRTSIGIARYDERNYPVPATDFPEWYPEPGDINAALGQTFIPGPLGAPTAQVQVPEGLYYAWADVPETALGAPSGVVKAIDNYDVIIDVQSPLGAPTIYGPPDVRVYVDVPETALGAPTIEAGSPDKVLWALVRSPIGAPRLRVANQYEAKIDVGLLRPSGTVLSGITSGWLDVPSPLGTPSIRALEGDDVIIEAHIDVRTPLIPTSASGAIPIGEPWGPTIRAVLGNYADVMVPETALGVPSIVAKDARVDGYLAVPETALGAPTITMGQDFFGAIQVPTTALGAPTISGFEVDNYNLYMDVRSPLGPASIYMEQGFGGYLSVPETALGAPTIAAGLDYISALRADTPLGAPSIVAEQGFGGYLSVPETALGAPTIEAFYEFDHEAYIDVAGPLGIPTILAQRVDNYTVYGDVPSPLFAPEILVQYDAKFFVDLSIPETALGVPTISGNQGLRVDIDIPTTALGVPAVLGTQGFIGELLVPNPLADQAPSIAAFNSFIGRLSVPSPLGAPSIAMAQGFFSALRAPSLPGAPSVEAVQGTGDGFLAVPETALGVPSLWMASVFVIVESKVTVTDRAVIRDYAYYGKVGATTVTDGAVIRDYAYTNNAKRETVLETAVITDRAFERAGALIATDSGVIRAYAYPDSSAKTVIVTETAVIIDHVYTPVTMTVTDSAVITDNATFSKEGRFTVTDTAVITSAVFDRSTSIQPPVQPFGRAIIFARALTRINAVRVTVHEEAFITDHAYPSGDPDDYVLGAADVWTANTMAWAMSRWATGDITGIAGEYGVANRGLFFESDTEYADMSMETGFINFGSPNLKSVPAMYSYATHPAPMTIQVTADIRGVQQTYTYREMARPAGDHRAVRTLFGKGLKSTYFKVGISSTGYTQIQYTVPVVQDLTRRI